LKIGFSTTVQEQVKSMTTVLDNILNRHVKHNTHSNTKCYIFNINNKNNTEIFCNNIICTYLYLYLPSRVLQVTIIIHRK